MNEHDRPVRGFDAALVVVPSAPLAVDAPGDEARAYVEAKGGFSKATLRAYETDWRLFTEWAASRGLRTLPADPGAVADYLVHLSREGLKVSSIRRVLSGLAFAHRRAGLDWFTPREVRVALRAIRRDLGTAPQRKRAVTDVELRAMLGHLELRDRAMLLVGWAAALRRSEVVALDVEDTELAEQGLLLTIRRSKTDQEGAGQRVGVCFASERAYCPVRTLQEHLSVAGIASGALFRNERGERLNSRTVARVVQRAARNAGLGEGFAGHSLRAGLATTAAQKGVSEDAIQRQGRWTNTAQVREYYRFATLFTNNATKGLL